MPDVIETSAYVGFCPYCGEYECEDSCAGPELEDKSE